MSQVHYHDVPLQDLVTCEVILVVRPDTPPTRQVEEPLTAEAWDGGEVPPFRYALVRYVVDEVIAGPEALAGTAIEVQPASLGWSRRMHEEYYVRGLSRSPQMSRYEPQSEPGDEAFIVFLRREDGLLEEAAIGARESLEQRALIERMAALTNQLSVIEPSSKGRRGCALFALAILVGATAFAALVSF